MAVTRQRPGLSPPNRNVVPVAPTVVSAAVPQVPFWLISACIRYLVAPATACQRTAVSRGRSNSTVPSAGPSRTGAGRTTGLYGPKAADTVTSPVIVTVQVRTVPAHAPPHPVSANPAVGTAVNVTDCPAAVVVPHDGGQFTPVPVTVPAPDTVTVSRACLPATWIRTHAVAVRPSGNLAWTLTWYVWAASQWCVVDVPGAVCPSPKLHCAATGASAPVPTTFRTTSWPVTGVVVDVTICTPSVPPGVGVPLGVWGVWGWGGVGGVVGRSPNPLPGSLGSYLATGRIPPSRVTTPACSLSGSLKNTTPSRVSNWNGVRGPRTRGLARTRGPVRSTTHTWPVV